MDREKCKTELKMHGDETNQISEQIEPTEFKQDS